MANLACVIASASSSANTNSILPWSNATQRTSVGPRPFGELAGTSLTLRGASRDLVETFVSNLADWAAKDRPGLVCHLNGYAQKGGTRK
jgi:hypothetical protein